jgi:nitrous oxidase accessory protein
VDAERNRILGSTTGIYLDTTPQWPDATAIFRGNVIAFEHIGLRVHSRQTGASFEDNDFHENTTQISADGNADALGCHFLHNRWSDYSGYDLNGDGLGDVPWEARSVSDSLRDRYPMLAFFYGTPAAWITDLLGAVVPLFSPTPLARDEAPRLGEFP